jgi:hypothetical protein
VATANNWYILGIYLICSHSTVMNFLCLIDNHDWWPVQWGILQLERMSGPDPGKKNCLLFMVILVKDMSS